MGGMQDLSMTQSAPVWPYLPTLRGQRDRRLVSSASAVAAARSLSAAGTLARNVAAIGALLASIASGEIHLPMVARAAHDRRLTRRVAAVLATLIIAAALGVGVRLLVTRLAL